MRCARCFAPRDIRVVESPDPVPGTREVVVAVRAVSICPSDLHIYRDGHCGGARPDHPMILGHEFAGVVAALGEGAQAPPVGTPVGIEPAWHCGECGPCRRGRTNICRDVRMPSYPSLDGAMGEYIACPDFSLAPLPEGVGFTEAALAEPLGVCVHAMRLAGDVTGERVAVLGAGSIGAFLTRLCRLGGAARIDVIEPCKARHAFARGMGADDAVATADELVARVGGTDDEPLLVFDAATAQGAFAAALEVCGVGGRVVAIGIPPHSEVHFDHGPPRRKELLVQFARRSRDTLHESLALIADGRVPASSVPVREFALEDAAEALAFAAAPPGRVLRSVVRVPE
jgi:threonine dehydrogenase-like Zn-dependent dehydrogenase